MTKREAAAAQTPADTVQNVSNWKVIGLLCSWKTIATAKFNLSQQQQCWNARSSAFLLVVRNVAHKNDGFFFFLAAITSWCWGHERGGSKVLRMVYGYPFIGAVAAASFPSPSRHWVSLPFDRVTIARPGLLFHVAPHDISPSRLIIFRGQDAVCFRERAFSPHTADRSHQEVKEVRSLFFFCVIQGKLVCNCGVPGTHCGSCCATLSWTRVRELGLGIIYALVAV